MTYQCLTAEPIEESRLILDDEKDKIVPDPNAEDGDEDDEEYEDDPDADKDDLDGDEDDEDDEDDEEEPPVTS